MAIIGKLFTLNRDLKIRVTMCLFTDSRPTRALGSATAN